MPFKYTNAVMVGNGLAGVSINVARLICLASFPGDDTGLLISTIVYFAISGGVLIFCTVT